MYKEEEIKSYIESLTPKQVEGLFKIAQSFSDKAKTLLNETAKALAEVGFEITLNQVQEGENRGNSN